jgi:hypothetical protein
VLTDGAVGGIDVVSVLGVTERVGVFGVGDEVDVESGGGWSRCSHGGRGRKKTVDSPPSRRTSAPLRVVGSNRVRSVGRRAVPPTLRSERGAVGDEGRRRVGVSGARPDARPRVHFPQIRSGVLFGPTGKSAGELGDAEKVERSSPWRC